ncbi:transposable element Tcb2 transposase [Trichonephila clavata]|uniref:Transposable element Tcb2 transposase n=1 Tax=Trichonephila clavata TaxID=2740835 RepID=A0A8X6IGQ7_TRICU|nr:transposable element Tcb2 transposase [Trichonephila clavata]
MKNAVDLNLSTLNAVREDLTCLWDLESLGIRHVEDKISELDGEILNKFENNLKFVNKRYETGLLWKDDKKKLGSNFRIAQRRFDDLIRKFEKDSALSKNYKEIVLEQQTNGVVEQCSNKLIENGYFMLHRPVLRDDKLTTKVRMVYDASSNEKHLNSLNNCLHSGPNLNPNILDMIVNFRTFNIAFCADLEKRFLQIGIKEEDRDYLKFLWFSNEKDNFKILRFTRAPFGVTCSPFILAATIKHHIRKYNDHPEVVKILDTSLYVDDFIAGSKSDDEAFYVTMTASNIFKEAGMHFRKFHTNSENLRHMWEENKLSNFKNSNDSLKVLREFYGVQILMFCVLMCNPFPMIGNLIQQKD